MRRWRRTPAELDLAKAQRQRNCRQRDQRQHPKDVHVGEIGRLRLHLLASRRAPAAAPREANCPARESSSSSAGACPDIAGRWMACSMSRLWWNCSRWLSRLEASETPIEPPVLRAALMSADAMSTRFAGILIRRGDDRDEDERQSDAKHHAGAGKKPEVEIAVHVGQLIHRDGAEDRADHD